VHKNRPYQILIHLIALLLLVSCGEAQYTIFYGGPILTMDQDFQSRENLYVIVKGEKIESVQALDTIDDELFNKAKK
jgi:uncharacterized lipoprotein YajG